MNDPGSRMLKTLTAVNEKSETFVNKKIEEYKLLVEEHTTWLNEILIEVKKSFVSPKIQILPKTPSAKRARKRRKATYTDTDNDDDNEYWAPPSKSRNTRGGAANDSASDFEDSVTETGRSTRSSRARGSRGAQTRSSRSAKSSSRNQKSDTSDGPASPVMNLLKAHETIEEVCEPMPTPKKTIISVLGKLPVASPKTPVTISSDDNQKNTSIDAFTGLRVTPKILVKNTPPKSPRFIPNFATLNVKEQAKAYEHMVSSSDEATPKMGCVKALKSRTPNVGGSDSEYGTPSSGSPMTISELKTPQQSSRTPATPNTVIQVPQTPPTVMYTSQASVSLSNDNTLSKVKSRILKQVPSGSVLSSEKEKPASRRSSVRKSTCHRLSMRAGLRKSKMSLNKRKSSIMHYQAPSVSAAVELEVIQSPHPQEEGIITVSPKVAKKVSASGSSLTGTPKQPGSKLRLKKSNRSTPTESPVPAPRRTTRTKTRQLTSVSSDDNVFSPTAAPKMPVRSTRTKSRQQTTSSSTSSTEGSVSSPAGQNRRVTRSKLRSAKSDLSGNSQSGENEFSAPEGTTRITRTKARKRQHTGSSDCAAGETVLPENKRRKSENPDTSIVLIDDSGDEPSSHEIIPDDVECSSEEEDHGPTRPAFHTPTHSSSFLNALKKVKGSGSGARMTGNLNGLVSSFIKRNTPKNKTALEKREEQKKELLKKRQQQEDRIQKIREQRKKEVELARKKREEHMKKVLAKKQQQEKELKENTKRTVEKTNEKLAITIQIREQKEKAEREKLQKMREKKLLEIEERKKQEEVVRLQKLKEKEEEERRHQEMLQRKREFEEKERAQKLQEERRQAEIKRREMEELKLKEQEQMRKQQEIQDKQRRKEQEEKEKQLSKERAERTQQELERKKEKERKEEEEREKERIRLQQQLADQRARQEEEERRKKEQEKLKATIKQTNQANTHSSLNTSVNNSIYASSKMNSTFEMEKNTSYDSYPMTPQGKKRCDNYDIEDMNSDDSTDDEDKPRKETPAWANGASLKASLLNQYYRPPDIDVLFGYSDMPDLTVMFSEFKQKNRFKKRTSSAVWDSPMYKSPK